MERKRTCKLCLRRFQNGRALGGHMRSHVTGAHLLPYSTSSTSSEEETKVIGSSYALRENPRKSILLPDPEFWEQQDITTKRMRRALPELPQPELVSSVSDPTPEEAVALCLMMLSRDSWTKSTTEEQQSDGSDDEDDEGEERHRGRSKHECGTCGRVFRSYQALGGHRASHKKARWRFQTGRPWSDQRRGSRG